jgi:hypothetical protein
MELQIWLSKELEEFIPSFKEQMNEYITKYMSPQTSSFFGTTIPIIKYNHYIDCVIIPEIDFEYGNFWLNFRPILSNDVLHLEVDYHFTEDVGQYRGKEKSNINEYEREFKDATERLEIQMKRIKFENLYVG